MSTTIRSRMSEFDLFAGLTDAERAAVAKIMSRQEMKRGDTLFTQGDTGNAAYVILDGRVDILVAGQKVAVLEKGAILGEASLVTDVKRSATAVVAADGTLWRLASADFQKLVKEGNPATTKIITRIAVALVQRLSAMNEKLVGSPKKREMEQLKSSLLKDWSF